MPPRRSALDNHDEPFMATAKRLIEKLRAKKEDLIGGKWETEIDARVLVAEIAVIRETLADMQELSNINFGEEDL